MIRPLSILAVDPSSRLDHVGLCTMHVSLSGQVRYQWSGLLGEDHPKTYPLERAAWEFVCDWRLNEGPGVDLRIVVEDQFGGKFPGGFIPLVYWSGMWRGMSAASSIRLDVLPATTWKSACGIKPSPRGLTKSARTKYQDEQAQRYARAIVEAEYARHHGPDGQGQKLPDRYLDNRRAAKFSPDEASAICIGSAYCAREVYTRRA